MSDAYIPLPPHTFERNPQALEECRLCGDSFASHPRDYAKKYRGIYADGCCAICGEPEFNKLHQKPDSGFDIPDDETL